MRTMCGALLLGPEHIEIRELPIPRPGPGELLLKVEAATTCGTDVKVFRRGGHPRMLKTPTLFGHEMSGVVAELGPGTARFELGDGVVVANSAPCGICTACHRGRPNLCLDLHYLNGGFAEYLLVPERFVQRNTHLIPAGLDFASAALTEPLACVLHGIDACELERHCASEDDEIVIYGAGPIGLLFVAALARENYRVLLADPNPQRLSVGETLGAARTICIERGGNQVSHILKNCGDPAGVRVAVDCTGVAEVWTDAINSVQPGGLVNLFGGCASGSTISLDTHRLHYGELTIKGVYHHRPDTIARALSLLSQPDFDVGVLLGTVLSIGEVEFALRQMMAKQVLKAVISGRHRAV